MAYQSYYPTEEEKKKQGSGSGVITGNPNAGSVPTGQPTAPTGSGFVNLDKYLNANQGQSQGLADTLTSGVEEDVEKQESSVQKINEDAQKEIEKKASQNSDFVKNNQNLSNNQIADFAKNATNVINSPYQSGVSQSVQDQLNQTEVEQKGLKEKGDNLTDNYYQRGLFKDAYNQGGNYTSGFGALDAFLVNADPSSRGQIKQAQGQLQGLDYSKGLVDFDALDTQGKSKYEQTQQGVQDLANQYYSQYDQKYQDALAEAGRINSKNKVKATAENAYYKYWAGIDDPVVSVNDYDAASQMDAGDIEALRALSGFGSQEYDYDPDKGSVSVNQEALDNLAAKNAGHYYDVSYDPTTGKFSERYIPSGSEEGSAGTTREMTDEELQRNEGFWKWYQDWKNSGRRY